MTRLSHLITAAFLAVFVGIAGLAPARAAAIPAGPALVLDDAARPAAENVRWVVRCGPFGCRRVWVRSRYYAPVRYYAPRRYYRRCVTRPRLVWTPYGYVRRWVRICR